MSILNLTYNYCNILARRLIAPFYKGERKLPLLHCSFSKILSKNFQPGSTFSFIQVGAYDGVSHDILFEFVRERRSSGIVIEPLRDIFLHLAENYSFNKNIIPVNIAVHSTLKEITLYRVDPHHFSELPDWVGGISSIDRLHHQKTNIPSEMIIAEKVPALPLMKIINDYYTEKSVNLLQIDTEGYDFEVLQSLSFDMLRPDVIKIEYVHLTADTIKAAIKLLRGKDYFCMYDQRDLLGIQLKRIYL